MNKYQKDYKEYDLQAGSILTKTGFRIENILFVGVEGHNFLYLDSEVELKSIDADSIKRFRKIIAKKEMGTI